MRIDELPERLLILGGGYVAAEFAHIFGAFGSHVTIVNRSPALLRSQDSEISERFTKIAQDQWDVRLETRGHQAREVRRRRARAPVRRRHRRGRPGAGRGGSSRELRRPRPRARPVCSSTTKDVVIVDDHQRTNVDGIWALGDIANHWQLKHVSNHEASVIQHNLLHLDDPSSWLRARRDAVPSAVFSSPQVASVGINEQDAIARGIDHVVARQDYGDVAYGWAMEDTTGFAKLLADPSNGQILGAHLLGAQASNLVQPIVQAMAFGQTRPRGRRGPVLDPPGPDGGRREPAASGPGPLTSRGFRGSLRSHLNHRLVTSGGSTHRRSCAASGACGRRSPQPPCASGPTARRGAPRGPRCCCRTTGRRCCSTGTERHATLAECATSFPIGPATA